MEFMRDIDWVMEREIAKGSCPLRFVRIEFGSSPYQEIASREKLLEVLSYLLRTGDYGRFAGKGTGNNVYMDIKGRKPAFKRTRSFIDRNTLKSMRHVTGMSRYSRGKNTLRKFLKQSRRGKRKKNISRMQSRKKQDALRLRKHQIVVV